MLKTVKSLLRQDKEPYRVPQRVQDVIPIRRIWSDGIFLTGNHFPKPSALRTSIIPLPAMRTSSGCSLPILPC